MSSTIYVSKERNTRSVRYTGSNFVVEIVVTLVVKDVEGLVVVVVLVVKAVVVLVVEALVVLVVEANEFVDVLVVLPVVVLNVVEEGVNEVKTEVVVFGPVFIAALVILVMRAENAVVGLVDISAVLIFVLSKAVEERVVEVNEEAVGCTVVVTAKLLVDVTTRDVVTTAVSVVGAVEVVTIVNSGIRICISV